MSAVYLSHEYKGRLGIGRISRRDRRNENVFDKTKITLTVRVFISELNYPPEYDIRIQYYGMCVRTWCTERKTMQYNACISIMLMRWSAAG